MSVSIGAARAFDTRFRVVVAGAGACGLVAALAARDAGAGVLVLERDAVPGGSTALSSGFIPAAGTRWQRLARVADSPERMAADIQRKNRGGADANVVAAVCAASAPTLEWLADAHAVRFVLVEGFLYPGHGAARMHAVPEKTGAGLMAALLDACEHAGVDILTSAHVDDVIATADGRVLGVGYGRPDGTREAVGCDALVLATSGFGGNAAMVREQLPAIAGATYFGHAGNQGDAIRWGAALGADVRDLTAYQGHGSVATPHGILISWALMMEGGFQVNARGERFSNEHLGYSEQCLPVLRQQGGFVWNVFDERLHRLGMEFDDYRAAFAAGAIRTAASAAGLAALCDLPPAALAGTLEDVARFAVGSRVDRHGRDFTGKPALASPYHAVRVTGALFHTQGGLAVDANARVLRADGTPLPNLFAGGGSARGFSGPHVWGYLSGNGLLSAVVLGRLAGLTAAAT